MAPGDYWAADLVSPARVEHSNSKERQPMKALVWHGKEDVRCDNVPDPKIEHLRDAIIRVTSRDLEKLRYARRVCGRATRAGPKSGNRVSKRGAFPNGSLERGAVLARHLANHHSSG